MGDELRLTEDLHLDSLGRVQLSAAIEERLGIVSGSGLLEEVQTLGELRRLVAGGAPGLRRLMAYRWRRQARSQRRKRNPECGKGRKLDRKVERKLELFLARPRALDLTRAAASKISLSRVAVVEAGRVDSRGLH